MKLSVIVPIYKVEKYLRKCVDSILNQDLPSDEYEVILVDDGSPDNCGAIADEYASGYANVRAVHQGNGGLSVARNNGLEVACGEYIEFVDSDDYLEPNVLGSLVEKMDSDGLDVLRFDYQNVNESYEVFEPYKDVKPFVDLRDEICDGLTFLNERLGYACYAVQFMIRRSLLVNNGLYFKQGIYYEDLEWTPRMLLAATRVTSRPIIAYNYVLRQGSITIGSDALKGRKRSDDVLAVNSGQMQLAASVSDSRWFYGIVARSVASVLTNVALFQNLRTARYYLKQIRPFLPLITYKDTSRIKRKIKFINTSPIGFVLSLKAKKFCTDLLIRCRAIFFFVNSKKSNQRRSRG